jgi:hypothetical protein
MQIPILSGLLLGATNDRWGSPPDIASGIVLSIESRLRLRSLHQYVESCRQALDGLQRDLVLYESSSEGSAHLQRASERLEWFCIEADSWGFNALYEIAFSLQMLLLNSGGYAQSTGFWESLQRGLGMLSVLLEQCEQDFHWRLAIADTLDCINQASGH